MQAKWRLSVIVVRHVTHLSCVIVGFPLSIEIGSCTESLCSDRVVCKWHLLTVVGMLDL